MNPSVSTLPDQAPRWRLKPESLEAKELASATGLPLVLAQLLAQRGIATAPETRDFLVPKLAHLSDPQEIPEMRQGIDRLFQAVDRQEKVILYGDYDVDGVTSVALMHLTLKAYGLETNYFVPMRLEEGYGLSLDGLGRCIEEFGKPDLVIALDCGTTSTGELQWLADQGVDAVIIDHHELAPEGRPVCTALVNPKQGDAFHYFCTAGLVFKVAHAMLRERRVEGYDLKESLDLVALGTVADLVPLVDENRLLVRRGLEALGQTSRVGLRALMASSGVEGMLQTHHIGFRLGPRINAAGRLDKATSALELLLTEDRVFAAERATLLEERNRERQAVELEVLQQAEAMLEEMNLEDAPAIVLGSREWHPGVIGIVASRISRRLHRPTILVAIDKTGMGKGSGRSVTGFSLVEAIDVCRSHLVRGGGHAMAAGISIEEEKIDAFRIAFSEVARTVLNGSDRTPTLELDAEIELKDITPKFLETYMLLEPFGQKNHEPTFLSRHVMPRLPGRVMKEKHLRLFLDQYGAQMDARWFNAPIQNLPPPPWDIAFRLQRSFFRGEERWTVVIEDARTAE